MAINYTVSYTFAPNTSIQSSQVNTNFSDNANTWTGLEALTKTFAKLKVDVDPATSLEVATKQYVDHYAGYRRPVLQYSSSTVVNIETGINGTSGQAQILFPDGNLRTDSNSARINCNLTQVAALSGSAASGLLTGSLTTNTSYAIYAVKVSDNASNFVTVADKTNLPLPANFASLNSFYGTNSWVYLGMIFNGDNSGATNVILAFTQHGNMTVFQNTVTGQVLNTTGIRLATTAGATSLSYTFAAGTGAAQIPTHIKIGIYGAAYASGSGAGTFNIINDAQIYCAQSGTGQTFLRSGFVYLNNGVKLTNGSSVGMDIWFLGYVDPVLGVGSNPLL